MQPPRNKKDLAYTEAELATFPYDDDYKAHLATLDVQGRQAHVADMAVVLGARLVIEMAENPADVRYGLLLLSDSRTVEVLAHASLAAVEWKLIRLFAHMVTIETLVRRDTLYREAEQVASDEWYRLGPQG